MSEPVLFPFLARPLLWNAQRSEASVLRHAQRPVPEYSNKDLSQDVKRVIARYEDVLNLFKLTPKVSRPDAIADVLERIKRFCAKVAETRPEVGQGAGFLLQEKPELPPACAQELTQIGQVLATTLETTCRGVDCLVKMEEGLIIIWFFVDHLESKPHINKYQLNALIEEARLCLARHFILAGRVSAAWANAEILTRRAAQQQAAST